MATEARRLQDEDAKCSSDPLYWLTHHTKTRDDHWREKRTEPYAPFPMKPYMPFLFGCLQQSKRLFIPKSREMLLSWSVMAYAVWLCQFHPEMQVIVQSAREDKSVDLVTGGERSGYTRVLWESQPEFLKILHPLTKAVDDMARDVFTWKNGSEIRGVPAGGDQFRQYHPYCCILEEASFLPEAEASYGAALPVASQIICVSSAGPGWFMDTCEGIMELPQAPDNEATVQMEVPKGCALKRDPKTGIEVLRVHYSANPEKGVDWVAKTKPTYKSESLWMQEQEIKGDAFSGQSLFPEFRREFTVIPPHPIPQDVVFVMGIDPHPRRPHAFLWMYVDRYDNHVIYRDYLPSRIYGHRGKTPDDDEIYSIKEYAQTILWLEGPEIDLAAPNGYTDNQKCRQSQQRRIMDTAGKAFSTTVELGKPGAETFWDTYAKYGISCEAAKKDFQAGRDAVGSKLVPRKYQNPDGSIVERSQILIFETCKELILELENCRYPMLTPHQAETQDPSGTPLPVRKHCVDILRYLECEDLYWIDPRKRDFVDEVAPYPDIPSFRL